MTAPSETVWEIEPHTRAKHEILKRYFDTWLPILATAYGKVLFIDGFAGPGVYKGGELGSPTIVLKATLDHSADLRAPIHFLFVEKQPDRLQSLKEQVGRLGALPDNITVAFHGGEFGELEVELGRTFDGGDTLPPTLAFLDPFGLTGFPMRFVKKLLGNPKSEVLITFMVRELDRFKTVLEPTIDELYGDAPWRECNQIDEGHERRVCLVRGYQRVLRDAGADFSLSFEMADRNNRTIYFLIYATGSEKGMEKMKEAMRSVDPSMGYRFADLNPQGQRRLFDWGVEDSWIDEAGRQIREHFGGQEILVEDVKHFVTCETIFPFRSSILKRLYDASPPALEYVTTPKKRGQFPAGTRVRFVTGRAYQKRLF